MQLGDEEHRATYDIEFLVINCWSPYNMILGQPNLFTFPMVSSFAHLKVKFPTPTGVRICKRDQKLLRRLNVRLLPEVESIMLIPLVKSWMRKGGELAELIDEVQLRDDPEKTS